MQWLYRTEKTWYALRFCLHAYTHVCMRSHELTHTPPHLVADCEQSRWVARGACAHDAVGQLAHISDSPHLEGVSRGIQLCFVHA